MNRRSRKLFSWTVITGLIFNLLSPLFLLPWQKVWACFGAWDCDGNSYCAGAGSYPDHPGSCASYGERGNNDRTTSEIAQDYINSGGNPAEVVTRTQDFQGALSNNDAVAAAAKAQELAVAEAQRIAAEQAAAAVAAANAAAAKAADDKAKVEAQRLAQEAAERSARAAANAAAAAAAMTPLSGAAPGGTPVTGAATPAAVTPVATAQAGCGSSAHSACSPNSDGNWYRCDNGSWQKADDCKPAGAINCVSGCAGANGCIPEKTPATYNGIEKVCRNGIWENKGTIPPAISQDPNPEEAMQTAMSTEDIASRIRGPSLPIVVNSPTARPIAAAPTTAVQPIAAPTAPATERVYPDESRARGLTVLPTPLPTAVIRRPVQPALTPTAAPTKSSNFFTPFDRRGERGGLAPTLTPIPTVKFSVPAAADREDRIVEQSPFSEIALPTNRPGGTTTFSPGDAEVKLSGSGNIRYENYCDGNALVTKTSHPAGGGKFGQGTTEEVFSQVCQWGCDGGACRPPTSQEVVSYRRDVVDNAIDQAIVRCTRSGQTNCSTSAVYEDAMQNVDAREPSPVQADIIRNTSSQLSVGDKKALIEQEYQNLYQQARISQQNSLGSGGWGSGLFENSGLTDAEKANLRRQAEENVTRILTSGNVDTGGGNILDADSNDWDQIGQTSAETAQGIIDQQKGIKGKFIAKAIFCSTNDEFQQQHLLDCGGLQLLDQDFLRSAWSGLIAGKSEQKIWDQGMEFGDVRSPGYQVREYNDKVAPGCGVLSSKREVTAEEYECLTGQTVAALYKWDTVDEQNQINAALNVASAVAGFGVGAATTGIVATNLVGKAGLLAVRSGLVSDLVLVPAFAETMTAGDRAEADVFTALAQADDISDDQRAIRQARADAAQAAADAAYNGNVISSIAALTVMNIGGEALGSVARQAIGNSSIGKLLLGNAVDGAATRQAASAVADEANRVIVGEDGTVWNVKPEVVVNPRTTLQEGELLIISPGERNARVATAAELVNLPEESLVWHRSPDGDEVLYIVDSKGNLHVVEPRQRTGQAGGAAGQRAVSAADIEEVAGRVTTTEDVVSAARDTRAALRGETDVLGEQAVAVGVNVPEGRQVSDAVATARTATAGRQGIGGIADRAADAAATIGYNTAGIVDRAGIAVNSALAEEGVVGRMIAGVEQPITNFGNRLETAVDGAVRSAGETIDAVTGKGRVTAEVALPESGTFAVTSIRDSAAAIQPLSIENVPRRIIDPNTLTDQIDPKLSSSADVYRLRMEIDGTETPVVVKVYRFSDAKTPMAFPNEINRAQIADQLGVGPRFHGIADLGDGRLAYIVDEVPGVTSKGAIAGQDFGKYVTRQTLEDVRTIEARLADNGFAVSGDFEFMITPDGRAVVIDPSAILSEPSSSRLAQTGGIMDDKIRILMEARAESQGVPGMVRNTIDSWSGASRRMVSGADALPAAIIDLDSVGKYSVKLNDFKGKTVVLKPGDIVNTGNNHSNFLIPESPLQIYGRQGDNIFYRVYYDGIPGPVEELTAGGISANIAGDKQVTVVFKPFSQDSVLPTEFDNGVRSSSNILYQSGFTTYVKNASQAEKGALVGPGGLGYFIGGDEVKLGRNAEGKFVRLRPGDQVAYYGDFITIPDPKANPSLELFWQVLDQDVNQWSFPRRLTDDGILVEISDQQKIIRIGEVLSDDPAYVYGSYVKTTEYPVDGIPDYPIDNSGHVTIKFKSPQPGLIGKTVNTVVPKSSSGGVGIAARIQSEIGSWADSVGWGRKNAPKAGVAITIEESIALPREGKSYLIGRSPKSDITTVDNQFIRVSREHARIANEGNNVFTVTDLDSTYGTYILRSGGEPIRVDPNATIPLIEGDIIRLGNPEHGYAEFDFAGGELNGPFYDRSANTGIGAGREGAGGGEEIIPAERTPEGIGGKVRNAVGEAGERIGEVVSGVREKILPSKIIVSEPGWNEKTIGIDGLQTEVDSLVRQAKDQGMPPGTKITISYFDDDLKPKTVNTKLENLAAAIRSALENNRFGTSFGDLSIKFGNSGIELGSVSNLSDPQNIVWNVRDIPTKAELSYLITHSADFRKKVVLARDLGIIGFAGTIGAAIGTTVAEVGAYYYVKPTTDRVPLKDPEAALRDTRNLPPNDYSCLGDQIVEVSAVTGEILKTLETCQSGCRSGMCQAKENAACQPGEHLKVSDSSESCSLSCVDGVYTKDFAQCDSIDLSGISTNRYREVVMQTLSILPDDFFPVKKFNKLSIYEVPLAYFSRGDIGDFSPEVNWREQEAELNGMVSISGEYLLIGRESLSEGLSGVSDTLIHELLHLWAYQSIKPLPEKMPYSYVASAATVLIRPQGTPFDYVSITGCLAGGAGSAFHDQPVDVRADNCQEDFAYAGTKYVLEACQLKNYSPERYEYFKNEVFRGQEYIPESGCPSQGG